MPLPRDPSGDKWKPRPPHEVRGEPEFRILHAWAAAPGLEVAYISPHDEPPIYCTPVVAWALVDAVSELTAGGTSRKVVALVIEQLDGTPWPALVPAAALYATQSPDLLWGLLQGGDDYAVAVRRIRDLLAGGDGDCD